MVPIVEPRGTLTHYLARVRVVTYKDGCCTATNTVLIHFNSLSRSRWQVYNDCKQTAFLRYPDTTLEHFEIVKISEVTG